MDIMELGAVGELVGGVAVVGSLLYVGLQVRQSRKEVETSNNQAQADAHAAYLIAISADPALSHAFRKLFREKNEREPLTGEEEERLVPILHAAFTQFQMAFYGHEEGFIRQDWRDHLAGALAGWLDAPFVQRWWAEQGDFYGPAFRDHVRRQIESSGE